MAARDPNIEYRAVAGFPGYEIGADGSVWSRIIKGPKTPRSMSGNWRRLKACPAHRGYLIVVLTSGGRKRTKFVHHLVLETFIGPRPKGMVARHFPNRDVANCAVTNLKWGTHKENAGDRDRDGNTKRGVDNFKAKLTEDGVRDIRLSKETYSVLAKRYGISLASVWHIKSRRTWRHVL